MSDYDVVGGLRIARGLRSLLHPLIEAHAPGTEAQIWTAFAETLADLQPWNAMLIGQRASRHRHVDDRPPMGPHVPAEPADMDPDLGPSALLPLVAPVADPRLALEAQNARWVSLFDALNEADASAWPFLDRVIPLFNASHGAVIGYFVDGLAASGRARLQARLDDGGVAALDDPDQLRGFLGHLHSPTTLLFRHNDLHIELQLDGEAVARPARDLVRQVLLEAAVAVVLDFENSGTSNVEEGVGAYRHWGALLDGTLELEPTRGDRALLRRPRQDRYYLGTDGDSLVLRGRSLMMVRTADLPVTTPCVRDIGGGDVYQGLLDAFAATVCALADLYQDGSLTNSSCGRLYFVKPERYGPDDVAFFYEVLRRIERLLDLERHRLVFIDTGQSQCTRSSVRAAATAAVRFFTPSFEYTR